MASGLAALSVVCDNADIAGRVLGQLKATVRRNFTPASPGFGAQVVSQVLNDPELNALWQEEVEAMRTRISAMRVALVKGPAGSPRRRGFFLSADPARHVQLQPALAPIR